MRADDGFLACRRGYRIAVKVTAPGAPEETPMKTWKKPKVDEIAVGLEINAYACAQV